MILQYRSEMSKNIFGCVTNALFVILVLQEPLNNVHIQRLQPRIISRVTGVRNTHETNKYSSDQNVKYSTKLLIPTGNSSQTLVIPSLG